MSRVNPNQIKGINLTKTEYFSNTGSDVGSNFQLVNDLAFITSGTTQDSFVSTNSGSPVLIASFLTLVNDPYLTQIPIGTWSFNFFGYIDPLTQGSTQLIFQVYVYHQNGSQDLIFQTLSSNITATSPTYQLVEANTAKPTFIKNTDRILVQVYAASPVSGNTPHFVFGSQTYPSYVVMPIPANNGATGTAGGQGSPGATGPAGPTGSPGAAGAQGPGGINAYSTTNGFTQPSVGTTVVINVPSGYWMQVGQAVYIGSGGYYQVASGNAPTFSIENLGYSGYNIPVGSNVSAAFISPAGVAGIGGGGGGSSSQGPQGSPGVTGATGPMGATGPFGGPQGSPGVTGATGPAGPTGSQGIQGSPGATGIQGIQGIQGSPGITGVTGIQGIQGSPGVTGTQGATGIEGATGATGPGGINAYSTTAGFTQPAIGAAVAIQIPSSYWMQQGQYVFIPSGGYYVVASGAVPTFSLQNLGYSGVNIPVGSVVSAAFVSPGGIAGTTGITGAQGPTGSQGIQGSPGITGATGVQGIQGSPGITGATGVQGIQGSPGITGATGIQGIQGSPGITGFTGAPGINAYSTTNGFTQPSVGAAIAIQIPSGYWIQQNQYVYIASGGYYQVASGSVPTFSLQNLGYSGVNIPVGSIVSAGFISPAGIAGTTGVTGAQGIQGSPGVTGATGAQGSPGTTGPQGSPGVTGATGPAGINAYSTTQGFTQPAIGVAIPIQVPSGQWMQIGQYVFIPSGGYYVVASGTVPTFSLQNLGYSGVNIPVGSIVSSAFVSPGGIQGAMGATGPVGPGSPSAGPQGSPGVTGPGGINAYSTSYGFTQPAIGVAIAIQIPSGYWIQPGQYVYIASGGYYTIASGSVPTFSLQNLGYSGVNIPVGSIVGTGMVSPGGIAGTTGATGIQGPQGIQGSPGVTGFTGAQGIQGSPGVTGATGPTGSIGPQGIQGSPGVTGATGPQGPTGTAGTTGFTGAPGINAYSTTNGFTQPAIGIAIPIQVPSGYWIQVGQRVFIASGGSYQVASGSVPTFSLQNLGYSGVNIPVGSIVSAGFISPDGVAGVTGVTGAQGIQGSPGVTGATGVQGIQGSPGVTGATGPQGSPGVTGFTGAPGINAYSTTNGFTQPAVGVAIPITIPSGYWIQIGQRVFIASGGSYQVASGAVPTFSLQNLGYSSVNIPVGSIVAAGFISPDGVAGVTGVTGAQGIQGSPGVTGFTGAQGIQGSPGVTGATGPQGSPGVTGFTGVPGINAYSTTQGFTQPSVGAAIPIQIPSGYWIQQNQYVFIPSGGYYQVASGSVPTFSLQNLGYSGANIPVGSIVSAGFISPAGIAGTTGVTGAQGIQGSPGVTGATGPQGNQGSPGITGTTGPQGSPGATGNPGINAYSTTAGFTQPAIGAAIAIQIPSGYWIQQNQYVYIASGGYYTIASGAVPTFSIQNLGYSGINIPVGSIVAAGFISPGGIAGTTGVTGTQGVQGSPGVTGATGPQGNQGSPGVTGFTGAQGSPGITGTGGINAYSTTQGFTQPAIGAAIPIQIPSSYWMQQGQYVFIPSGGYYVVASGAVPTFSLQNLGYSGVNIPIGSIVSAAFVSPGGIAGTTGITGAQGIQGSPGVTGATGPQGNQGSPGVTGFTGAQGSPGITGTGGINAYSTTNGFTQPAVGAAIPIQIPSGYWIQQNQYVYIASGGYYTVASGSVPTFSLQNLGYSGVNIPVGSIVAAAFISPGGIAGTTGVTGVQGIQGSPGVTGFTGAQGIQGSPGVTGFTGAQGSPGVTGFTGAPGINAYSTTNGFTQPAINVAISITIPSAYWLQQNQYVYIASGGYYSVASAPGVPTFGLLNLGYSGANIPIGSVVSAGFVSPAGIAGTTGVTGAQGIQGSPGVTGFTGAQGSPGITGATGPGGINAYSTTNGFTQPALNVAIPLTIPSSYWIQQGQYVFIPSGGYYQVASGSVPTFSLQNLGYSGVNIPVGSIVSAAFISPGGVAGTTGTTGAQGIQGSPGVTGATGPQGPSNIIVGGDLIGTLPNPTIQSISSTGAAAVPVATGVMLQFGWSGAALSIGPSPAPSVNANIKMSNPAAIYGLNSNGTSMSLLTLGTSNFLSFGGINGSVTNNAGIALCIGTGADLNVELNGNTYSKMSLDPVSSGAYLSLRGPGGANNQLVFQIQSGSASFTYYWPGGGPSGGTGMLMSTPSGNLFWSATGAIGPQGIQGSPGITGFTGAPGINAYSTTQGFTQPAIGAAITIQVPSGYWIQQGQYVFIPSGGYYTVASAAVPTFGLINLGYSGVNLPIGSTISAAFVSPGGVAGVTGFTGPQGNPGSPGITGAWFITDGITLGNFNTLNFVNNLIGTTGTNGVNVSATGLPTGAVGPASGDLMLNYPSPNIWQLSGTGSNPIIANQAIAFGASPALSGMLRMTEGGIAAGINFYDATQATGIVLGTVTTNGVVAIGAQPNVSSNAKIISLNTQTGSNIQMQVGGNNISQFYQDPVSPNSPVIGLQGPGLSKNALQLQMQSGTASTTYYWPGAYPIATSIQAVSSGGVMGWMPVSSLIGATGFTGPAGINAYSTTNGFTQPNIGSAISITVPSGQWMQVGQYVFVPSAGYYTVASAAVPTFGLVNLGYSGVNLPVGSTISAAFVSPGGVAGATGATGPQGTNGTGVWHFNNGATVMLANNVNLVGGLVGITGPNANEITINNLGHFYQGQSTGAMNPTGIFNTFAVQWMGPNIQIGNVLGATNIGTGSAYLTFNGGTVGSAFAYYEVKTQINFTGVPSGLGAIVMQQFLGATGALSTATTISQSVVMSDISTGVPYGGLTNNYFVVIPSGTNISTWVYYIYTTGTVGSTGPRISPTGTNFSVKMVG